MVLGEFKIDMEQKKIHCEIFYFPSPHLNQIYDGFERLKEKGIISIKYSNAKGIQNKPILKVIVNEKYNVIYDTLDGFNWIDGSIEENLSYFKSNFEFDYYFKRSFNNKLLKYKKDETQIFPLGLNYEFYPNGNNYPKVFKDKIKSTILNNEFCSKLFNKQKFIRDNFEYYPYINKQNKILFLTRLWNPNETKIDYIKKERIEINENRVNCIRACKKEFGNLFLGGLSSDPFSEKYAKDLILPNNLTNRQSFINLIREHNICISTLGLHESTGWKFAEYVAGSRAIITEPLKYDVPGNFLIQNNYLEFQNVDQLLIEIEKLIKNKELLQNMMINNYNYYNNFVKSDVLILNSLKKIEY